MNTAIRSGLAALLATVSVGAMAEWVGAGTNDIATVYIEASTLDRGNGSVWVMHDFLKPFASASGNSRSAITHFIVGCEDQTYAIEINRFYSDPMGGGSLVREERAGQLEFKKIPANSTAGRLVQWMCAPARST